LFPLGVRVRLAKISTLFFDIGGVILTNGWDSVARRAAINKFQLDFQEFEARHLVANPAFERGQMTLDEYLEQTIFYSKRTFSLQEFRDFMYSQSQAMPESLEYVRRIARSRGYLIATINNEGAEINAYRIEQFSLRDIFAAFFSSCYVGMRKPDTGIYELALKVLQRSADESIFVDDRAENIEGARKVGLNTIQFKDVPQLEGDLNNFGVQITAS
jgi:putative hydrolase of the HAD superfamily